MRRKKAGVERSCYGVSLRAESLEVVQRSGG